MNHFTLVCFAICLAISTWGSAAEKTDKVSIQSVDPKESSLIVIPESGGEELSLEVLKKAIISVGGTAAKLADLEAGQKATITYDPSLSVATKIQATERKKPAGEVELFNGNDLDGWKFVVPPGPKAELDLADTWGVDAERRVLFATGHGSSWLETEDKCDNFSLSLEWRFVPSAKLTGNGSGVVIRASGIHSFKFDPRGVEIDISAKGTGNFICYGTPLASTKGNAAGEKTQNIPALREPELKEFGEWNSMVIRCDGDRIAVDVNGKRVNEGTGVRVKKGEICLRSQNSAIEFRKIRLTPIKTDK
jgi:hypothetical protein